jgi:hypothetical protein
MKKIHGCTSSPATMDESCGTLIMWQTLPNSNGGRMIKTTNGKENIDDGDAQTQRRMP